MSYQVCLVHLVGQKTCLDCGVTLTLGGVCVWGGFVGSDVLVQLVQCKDVAVPFYDLL